MNPDSVRKMIYQEHVLHSHTFSKYSLQGLATEEHIQQAILWDSSLALPGGWQRADPHIRIAFCWPSVGKPKAGQAQRQGGPHIFQLQPLGCCLFVAGEVGIMNKTHHETGH